MSAQLNEQATIKMLIYIRAWKDLPNMLSAGREAVTLLYLAQVKKKIQGRLGGSIT